MSGPQILVVDDEPLLREILVEDFKFDGFDVIEASSGNEAFELLLQNPSVKVVLSDIRMPNGSGMDLLAKVQAEIQEKPKVVLISGFADVNESEALAAGATALFKKPFNNDMILEFVKGVI